MDVQVDIRRVRVLKEVDQPRKGPVVYWMQREQRVEDNWALLFAQQLSISEGVPLIVCFNVVKSFLGATLRQYEFMLRGLEKTLKELENFNIPSVISFGEPKESLVKLLLDLKPSTIVTDLNPLKTIVKWKEDVVRELEANVYEVDSHNIVPVFYVSQKQEYGAYTLRPKISRVLSQFLTEFPTLKKMPSSNFSFVKSPEFNVDKILSELEIDRTVLPVSTFKPGSSTATNLLSNFIAEKLKFYKDIRNDPTVEGTSNLSTYMHFGQISPQRVALEVKKFAESYKESVDAFLEELIVRRELSDNFCFYNQKYDSVDGFPDWARASLIYHESDEREYVYTLQELENAKTHDPLWNSAQRELILKGKMHGYMRMYWAKKILEWTGSAQEAFRYAIYLNDKYELDGRDPNGYAGIAWAIGGVHDRPWAERQIFGKIRYMSYEGCARKFNVDKYIQLWYNI